MSATESKVKTAPKTSKKTLKSAEAEALKVALDAAQVEYVPVTALVKSPERQDHSLSGGESLFNGRFH